MFAGRPAVGFGYLVRVYLLWPGVVSVLLGMMCVWAVVGSMGAMVVSSWASWAFFTIPGWLSRHI